MADVLCGKVKQRLVKMYKIPKIEEKTKTKLATDKVPSLKKEYNLKRKLTVGKYMREVALVYKKLKDWQTIERADLIIPYEFTEQKNLPTGYRIWYLSQSKGGNYYNGQFFDLKISGKKKQIRKECKLSKEAIKFFSSYDIKNGDEI